jgi:hypothetical protein
LFTEYANEATRCEVPHSTERLNGMDTMVVAAGAAASEELPRMPLGSSITSNMELSEAPAPAGAPALKGVSTTRSAGDGGKKEAGKERQGNRNKEKSHRQSGYSTNKEDTKLDGSHEGGGHAPSTLLEPMRTTEEP